MNVFNVKVCDMEGRKIASVVSYTLLAAFLTVLKRAI